MTNQISRQNINKVLPTISFSSYEVLDDRDLGGFNVKLNWKSNSDAVFYKIYKIELPRSVVAKKFNITQKTLEKTTATKFISNLATNILYTRNHFSISDNVNFAFSGSSGGYPDEPPINKLFELKQIPANKNQTEFHFIDKNVKFGKTYQYAITFTNISLQETRKILPITVSIQDLRHPEAPTQVYTSSGPDGIALVASNTTDNRIVSYKIFKRNAKTFEDFKFLTTIESRKGIGKFLDKDVVAGNEYEYKVFSQDYFDTLSIESKKATEEFDYIFVNEATIPYPKIKIINDRGQIRFIVEKNHPKLIGFTVQRKDVWRYETDFTFKSYSSLVWPNIVLFDKNGIAEFIDLFTDPGRNYQYRIYTVTKAQRPASYYFSPIIDPATFDSAQSGLDEDDNKAPFSLSSISTSIVDSKQHPKFLNIKFSTTGHWTHGKVIADNFEVNFDSMSNNFFLELKESKKYKFNIIFYENNTELKTVKNIMIDGT